MNQEINAKIHKQAKIPTAYEYAITLLSKKNYSELKLKQKIATKKYSLEEIDQAIEKIKEKNFLREDYYIEGRAKGLLRKGYSPQYIALKIQNEGPNVSAEDIINIANENGIDLNLIKQELVNKKLKTLGPEMSEFEKKCKIRTFLSSKGHYC
ncbi:MAG: regulatory protein RecX [Halobacteriovoraceae bacterium]|nr:regulatory protein RecX [Halobacteriovoraceae bacterium]